MRSLAVALSLLQRLICCQRLLQLFCRFYLLPGSSSAFSLAIVWEPVYSHTTACHNKNLDWLCCSCSVCISCLHSIVNSVFALPTGQEREQVQNRSSEVVNTRESVIETTPADPCGGVPTAQYNSGSSGTGATGAGYGSSSGTTTGAGYGTSTGATGTGAGYGSGSGYGQSGSRSGTSGKGQEYDASGGQVDDRSLLQKGVDAVKPGSQVGQHGQNR